VGWADVVILHPEPGPTAGPLTRALAAVRARLAEHHRAGFLAAGATTARVVAGPADDTPFGRRVRGLATGRDPQDQGAAGDRSGTDGLVVLGSGAIPLAGAADRRPFVEVAASGEARALANNRYSADVVAVGRRDLLAGLPDLAADNALPRWLDEFAGATVADLRGRWRLALDLDGPLDVLLAARATAPPRWLDAPDDAPLPAGVPVRVVEARIDAVAARLADRRAEVVVAGRTSAAALGWLERAVAARVRALVEERGLRAADRLARAADRGHAPERPPASVLGMLLDRDGPGSLGALLGRLGDVALVDTRVLLAHRLGPDERAWPPPEDRFASDLLDPERIDDPWLRELTAAALRAPIPVLLGGHTLVGPGIRLVARAGARRPGVGG
jgi:hypothetical protein